MNDDNGKIIEFPGSRKGKDDHSWMEDILGIGGTEDKKAEVYASDEDLLSANLPKGIKVPMILLYILLSTTPGTDEYKELFNVCVGYEQFEKSQKPNTSDLIEALKTKAEEDKKSDLSDA